jgi:hypothetical protein
MEVASSFRESTPAATPTAAVASVVVGMVVGAVALSESVMGVAVAGAPVD